MVLVPIPLHVMTQIHVTPILIIKLLLLSNFFALCCNHQSQMPFCVYKDNRCNKKLICWSQQQSIETCRSLCYFLGSWSYELISYLEMMELSIRIIEMNLIWLYSFYPHYHTFLFLVNRKWKMNWKWIAKAYQ